MDETISYKNCPEYFGNFVCAKNFLLCPLCANEHGLVAPKGCEDMMSPECIYVTLDNQNVVP